MPVANKLRDIYMANSIEQLNEKASKISDIKSLNLLPVSSSLSKLFESGKKALEDGDEERAYVFYFRYCEVYLKLIKTIEYKNDKDYANKMVPPERFKIVLEECENLKTSLARRYQEKNSEYQNRSKEIGLEINDKTMNFHKNLLPEKMDVDYAIEVTDLITCEELFDSNDNSANEIDKILAIDIRSSESFEKSHITKLSSIQVINVPDNLLTLGLTGKTLETKLPFGETLDCFKRRRQYKKIVIVDQHSDEFLQQTPAKILFDCLTRWDTTENKIKSTPLLLKGGFNQWILTYPMFVTNPHVVNESPYSYSHKKQTPLIVNYNFDVEEDKKDENKNIVNGLMNGQIAPDKNSDNSNNQQTNLLKYTTTPYGMVVPGTAKPVPMIPERSTKPQRLINSSELIKTPPATITTTTASSKNEYFIRKQLEATEEMNKVLKQENENIMRKIEEKQKEEKQKEKEERQKENVTAKMNFEQNGKQQFSPEQTPEKKLNASPRNIIENNKISSPQTVNGGVKIHVTGDEINSDQMHTKPKQLKTNLTVNTGLSSMNRSLSSPNIAQLLLEEENELNNKTMNKTPTIDRNLKPANKFNFFEASIDNKIRDFAPVYGTRGQTFTGLKNLGNTCFMNASIQCLLNTPGFAHYFKGNFPVNRNSKDGSNGEITMEMRALINAMAFPSLYKSIAPKDFKNTFVKHWPYFNGNEQQDAHEFLVMLFEKLHHDLNEPKNNYKTIPILDNDNVNIAMEIFWENHTAKNNSIISRSFEGLFLQSIRCYFCEKVSNTFEVFSLLSIPIMNTRCSLIDCLELFMKPEKMSGESAYECPNCKVKRDASKQMSICKMPRFLAIHLKRFSFSYDKLWRDKLSTFVDFPLDNLCIKSKTNTIANYSLYAVINHYGTCDGGHYVAFAKNPVNNKWLKYDDQEVTSISQSDVVTQAAYILFYAAN